MATRTGATGKQRAARAEPSKKPDYAREAWALLTRLFKAEKGKHLAALELTMPQAQLLLNLDPDRPVPMNTLADTLGCDASNVTGLVDRLESRRLIERRADPADRRVKMIAVTGSGAEFRTKLLARWYEPPAGIAALPDRDKKALLQILRRAAEGATDQL